MSDKQLDQRRRAVAAKLVDLIANDTAFRQQFIDDTQGALESAGMYQEFNEVAGAYLDTEVAGYDARAIEDGGSSCSSSGCY